MHACVVQNVLIVGVVILLPLAIGLLCWTMVGIQQERFGPLVKNSTLDRIFFNFPINSYRSIYVFNLSNYQDFVATRSVQRAVVSELGPYVFRIETKITKKSSKNGTLDLDKSETLFFEPSMSNGSLGDKITTANYNEMRHYYSNGSKRGDGTSMKTLFINATVNEYLFAGYNDPEVGVVEFGYFAFQNASTQRTVRVYTDTKRVNQIVTINTFKTLRPYGNRCNAIEGTDGTLFPAFEEPPRSVKFYSDFFFKPWSLYLQKRWGANGQLIARFQGGSDLFNETGDLELDNCFCEIPTHVKGTFDASRFDATASSLGTYATPVVASLPHFLHGDPLLRANVSGLHPDEKKHHFYIDVHASSGLRVDMRLRMQTNLRLVHLDTEPVPSIILPIFWTEDANLPSDRDYLLCLLKPRQLVSWTALAACLCSLATSALLCGLLL